MVVQKKNGGVKNIFFKRWSSRSKHLFYIDIEGVEGIFITRDPQFYKGIFQSNIQVQYEKIILH